MLPQFKALHPPSRVIVVHGIERVFKVKEKKIQAKKEFKEKSSSWGFSDGEKKEEMKRIENVAMKQTKIKTSGDSHGTARAPRFLSGVTGLWVVDTVPYAGSVFTVRWPYNK